MTAVFVGGRYNGMVVTAEELEAMGNGRRSEDLSELRARGCLVHRAELDNQPLVDGYLSPMWDGGRLRYETYEVYDMLSR